MQSIEMRLVVGEPLTRDSIRTGFFPIPAAMAGAAGANLEREVLLIEARPERSSRAIGTASIQAVFATGTVPGPAMILSHLRLFREPIPVPLDDNDPGMAELPDGMLAEVARQLASASEFSEPPQAGFIGEASDEVRRAACEASGWRCNLTGEDIPRLGDLREYILPVIPNLFGGAEQPGNLLVVLPSLHNSLLKGAISFDDEGRLLLIAARLAPGLLQRLRPGYALRQPGAPFTIAPATLRRHRELIFCNPSLRD